MTKEEVYKRIKEANKLSSENDLKAALEIYLPLREELFYQKELMLFIASCYFDMENWEEALNAFKSIVKLYPENEYSSLSLYICFIEKGETEKAIEELKRYASLYSIDMYRDTLKELIEGLSKGYSEFFKETILELAKKHDVAIRPAGSIGD